MSVRDATPAFPLGTFADDQEAVIRNSTTRRRVPMTMALLALAYSPLSAVELRAQSPGDDFFAYANRAWLNATVLPPGKDRWTVRDDINARTRQQLATIFDDVKLARPGSLARKVADFRAAYLNEPAIEANGVAPLAPMFARIDRITDKLALTRLLGSSMRADVDPLNLGVYQSSSVLGLAVEHSIHGEKTYTAFLVQGGLGLGDRDQYLSVDSNAVRRRGQYEQYIARVLGLAGLNHADQRAEHVLALETALATSHATREASAVDRNADHQWTRSEFAHEAPGMDWNAFLEAAGLDRQITVVAWQPIAMKAVSALVATRPIEYWKDYLRFHAINEYADVLPRAFADAAAEFRGDGRTRDERALAATQTAMAGAIGELYAKRYFSPAQKARVLRIIANVTAEFREHVARASWLSPQSRKTAVAKIDALYVGIGYPEAWEDWTDLRVDAADALGNAERVAAGAYRRALARLNQPFDRHEWSMPPQTVGALLNFQQNAYTFSAALLQPPKYDSTASDAAMYGAIGAVIGHDVSHFVDVLGAEYESDGRMHRWWTTGDSARFEAAAEPLVQQFSAYEALPGVRVDGRLTRTENVADLAGLTAAFEAHRKALGAKISDKAYVRGADREFFVAFAQAFGTKMTEAGLRAQLATDHAPEIYRFNTVRNLDAWYDAFDVVSGQRLYLEPSARVKVW